MFTCLPMVLLLSLFNGLTCHHDKEYFDRYFAIRQINCSIWCYINDYNIEMQEPDINIQISLWLNMLLINSTDCLYDLLTLTDLKK